MSTFQHGAWTQEFLVCGLMAAPPTQNLDLAQLFALARSNYVRVHRSRGDQPCFFAGQNGSCYNTEETAAAAGANTAFDVGGAGSVPPAHSFQLFDWLGTPTYY